VIESGFESSLRGLNGGRRLAIRQSSGLGRGWSKEELVRREKFFFSIYLKRSVAMHIYNNPQLMLVGKQVENFFSR
jgi:hypothetical protein